MPRISRSAAQRYANAAKNKPKRRGEPRAPIRAPLETTGPVELPAGLASPAPLDLAPPRRVEAAPPRPARVPRAEARGLPRAEVRTASRRVAVAPIVDYGYVIADLKRIGLVALLLVLVLFALTLVPGLH